METIIAIAVFVFLMAGVASLFKELITGYKQKDKAINNVDQARALEFTFGNELRNAGYGNDGSYPLNQAGNTQIIFFSNYRANSTSTMNRIRYFVASTTLYKGVVVPTGNPLSYNLSNESTTTVLSDLTSSTTPVFYYYNGNYAGTSSPLAQPINVNQVKFIKMNLVVLKQDVKNSVTSFVVSSGSTIRNLKTNLGN